MTPGRASTGISLLGWEVGLGHRDNSVYGGRVRALTEGEGPPFAATQRFIERCNDRWRAFIWAEPADQVDPAGPQEQNFVGATSLPARILVPRRLPRPPGRRRWHQQCPRRRTT